MSLLTHEAAEAVEWLFKRIPDRHFDEFKADMEAALDGVLTKFGFDETLRDAFRVKKLVAERPPVVPGEDEFTRIPVTIYNGNGVYAITKKGKAFCKDGKGRWNRARLSPNTIKARSITRHDGHITVRNQDL